MSVRFESIQYISKSETRAISIPRQSSMNICLNHHLPDSMFGGLKTELVERGLLRYRPKIRWFAQTPLASRPGKRKGNANQETNQFNQHRLAKEKCKAEKKNAAAAQ